MKNRKHPSKPPNYGCGGYGSYGLGDFTCPDLEKRPDGTYWCHNMHTYATHDTILNVCHGNRYSCIKQKYALLACMKTKSNAKRLRVCR
jgi:hypothetical protein